MSDANVKALLTRFSVEVTPKQVEKFPTLTDLLPRGTRMYIAHIDGTPFSQMLATAKRLRAEGFEPMPHLPARVIPSARDFSDWMAAYVHEAGVREVLALGGGLAKPRGPFDNSMQLLETGVFDRHGIRTIGVAGHPEGNKDIGDTGIAEALAWKNAYAARSDADFHIVTQFAFEAQPLIDWAYHLRAAGNTLPIHIGVAGPAKLSTLIKYATMCGIGPSMRVLTKQAANISKLMTVSGPDELVGALARHTSETPDSPIAQLHFFPLGGLKQTAQWISDARGGLAPQTSDAAVGGDIRRQVA